MEETGWEIEPGFSADVQAVADESSAWSQPSRTSVVKGLPFVKASRFASISALIAADLVAWLGCVAAILLTRWLFWEAAAPFWGVWVTGALWVGFRLAAGLYPPEGLAQPEELRRSFRTTVAAALLHLCILIAVDEFEPWRIVVLAIWPLLVPASYFTRSFAKLILIRRRQYGNPYVVIGTGERAARAIREMKANPELGMIPIAAFGDDPEFWGQSFEGIPVLGPTAAADRRLFPFPVRHAIIAVSGRNEGTIAKLVATIAGQFPTVQLLGDFSSASNLWARPRPLGPYLAIETNNLRLSARQRKAKRVFDLVLAVPLLIFASPAILVAACLVRFFSPGPAFFSQTREGLKGEPVRIWKIRTMVPEAEKRLIEYLSQNPDARFEWEQSFKLRNDPRIIPKVGGFLRKSSIDELPQLWNVIRGDLSLVGPRIMPRHEVDRYSSVGRDLRRDVPPGLTGLWQIMYRNNSDLRIREVADSYYVQNWSPWLDGWILLRTVRTVLAGSGAY